MSWVLGVVSFSVCLSTYPLSPTRRPCSSDSISFISEKVFQRRTGNTIIIPAKTDRIKHVASSEVVLIYTGKARCEWMHVTNAASVLARSTGMTCVHHRWLRSTAADAYSHFEKGNSGVRVACSGHMQLHTYASQNNHSSSKSLGALDLQILDVRVCHLHKTFNMT